MQLNLILNKCTESLIIVESFAYMPILAHKNINKIVITDFFAQYYTCMLYSLSSCIYVDLFTSNIEFSL